MACKVSGRCYCLIVAELRQSDYPGRWWTTLPDGRIECRLCPRFCKLNEGQHGFCFVRQRVGDRMVLTTYGRSSGFVSIRLKRPKAFLAGDERALVRHGWMQSLLPVLSELRHLQSARMGQARRCSVTGTYCTRGGATRMSVRCLYLQ
jgi:hypothetical protein